MKKWLLFLTAAVVATHGSPGAAMMRGLSTEELTGSSTLVVEGTVEQVRSYWSDDGRSILSSATISVLEVVRGRARPRIVTVEYEGGEVGEVGMGVSDMAPLPRGQRVLVFLQEKKASRAGEVHAIVGRSQGVYKIGADRVARKDGFTLMPGSGGVDNDLDVDLLKAKIRGLR